MSIAEIEKLLDRYLSGQCSAEEILLLDKWLELEISTDNDWTRMEESNKKRILASLFENINRTVNKNVASKNIQVVKISLYKKAWVKIAVAAVVIFLVAGYYLYVAPISNKRVAESIKISSINNDIAPGGNKAVLTLADNSVIVLDNIKNGALAQQGNVTISKLADGQLAYLSSNEKSTEVLYNLITTPRGGQYQLILADGSKVWLNAASSIRFPTRFNGTERKVEISGEAYFEVTKNAAIPFKVYIKTSDGEDEIVEVLGTHFNINSYGDEFDIKTTLLEGSVKVSKGKNRQTLTPGQQADLKNNGLLYLIKDANIDEVMAWKNGKFQFDEATDLVTIMKQIARWYDIEIEYKEKITSHIGGSISRDVNISEVLEMLEMTGTLKFQINGKKVIVQPKKTNQIN
jgi:ferric-dicitrate binding protein FerR (iron transport regulator)